MTSQKRSDSTTRESIVLHATTVAVRGWAVVIVGPSGSGKSALALQLMAFGAELVADDRTLMFFDEHGECLVADAPPTLPALIEARSVGLLPARLSGPRPVALMVDLGVTETARLPPERRKSLLGHSVPLLHFADNAHFPHAVLQILRGREDP